MGPDLRSLLSDRLVDAPGTALPVWPVPLSDAERIERWRSSGAAALTGRSDGPPLDPSLGLVERIDLIGRQLSALVNAAALRMRSRPVEAIDPFAMLALRARHAGLERRSPFSCGGSTKLLRLQDGWMALCLARPSDVESLPALLGIDDSPAEPWAALERSVFEGRSDSVDLLLERAVLLGLAVARMGETPVPSAASFVDHITSAVTPRTKVIEVMHISFQTGFIAPVRAIVDFARPRGIKVFVDGAHAFAHFPFTRDELGCDYYGTSLHKWLHAPIGTGFLYVRRDKVKGLWPLMAGGVEQEDNIRKYEEIGTHPAANHNAISVAIAFHRSIGAERKIARLRYLRDRWAHQVLASSDRARMITKIGPGESGAIGVLAIDGMDMNKLGAWLLDQHHIVTTPLVNDEFQGLRITPNVYNTPAEVDLFADRVSRAIRRGMA